MVYVGRFACWLLGVFLVAVFGLPLVCSSFAVNSVGWTFTDAYILILIWFGLVDLRCDVVLW